MIARTWRCRVARSDASAAAEYIRQTGLAECREVDGYCGGQLLRRDVGAELCEFVLVTCWESLEAVARFAGSDVSQAVLYPGDEQHFIQADRTVTHREIVYSERPGSGGMNDSR